MNFDYTDEQRSIQETIRRFGHSEIAPKVVAYTKNGVIPDELVKKLRGLGLLGGIIPSEYGGSGMDHISWVITIEELARFDPMIAVLAGAPSSLLGQGILRWGTQEQKQKYLVGMMREGKMGAAAITEPNIGTDVGAMETTARREGNTYVLNGTKLWITGGNQADWIMVFASLDRSKKHKGITGFIVERGTPGLSTTVMKDLLIEELFPPSEVVFSDCAIPMENRLGAEEEGFKILSACLDMGRIHVAARALGISQSCLDACVKYANERRVFGHPIGHYQLIKSMITNMVVGIEAGRLLVYRAAHLRDQGKTRTQRESSIAKMFAADLVMKTTTDAIQIHGAYGIADEYRMSTLFRWAKVHQIVEGTSQLHRLIIADYALGYRKE